MEEANDKALAKLHTPLQETVSTTLKAELLFLSEINIQSHLHPVSSPAEPRHPCSLESLSSLTFAQPRGRSRERFKLLQDQLVLRARSVSSERDLRKLIMDARTVAAVERVNENC